MKYKIDIQKLRNLTFFQYLNYIYDYEMCEYIKDSFGYDSEFLELNAEAALLMFKDDFILNDDNYYILNGGLLQIIDKLESRLKNDKNVKIIKECTVKDINNNSVITEREIFYYKKLICTISQKNLYEITYFKDIKELQDVKPIPLLRIYFKYPKD